MSDSPTAYVFREKRWRKVIQMPLSMKKFFRTLSGLMNLYRRYRLHEFIRDNWHEL
ncbi:hypothetical protein CFBP1590__5218 [Pseudomonas viridiflava]|uniref:Uncharacterized protein n=1 Tax=Pseudomonas viridiflava TaxID=33069 RepID=A0A1Y6JSJ8_PSEVI|nr:hypothetical protein CFBP1590__5218 [Pseudomonas viridiflava]VVO22592.1 hypothetical protein PS689_04357 [Pseudomonas fluorescens]